MTVFDVANNSVAMVDWHSPHAKRQVMENIQRFVDAYVQEKVAEALLDFTISALDYFSKKSTTGQQGERGIYSRTYQKFGEFVNSEYPKISANRNKVNS